MCASKKKIAVQWKIMQHLPPLLQIWLSCNWYSISGVWLFFGHFVSSPIPCAQSTRSAARAGYSHIQSMTSHTAASGKITALLVGMEIDTCKKTVIAFNTAQHWAFWQRRNSANLCCDKHAPWLSELAKNTAKSYHHHSSSYKMLYIQTFI